MKKILSLMLCAMMFTAAFAQTESEHLTFMGVPIDGTLSSFVKKLEQKGLTLDDIENDIMKGNFAGYDNCKMFIMTARRQEIVYSVGVNFPESDKWSILSSNYFRLKEMLATKYGKPIICTEKFDSYSEPNDDQTKIFLLKNDKCDYSTSFRTPKGDIILVISHVKATYQESCYVSLIYVDAINYENKKSEAIDDL